jgi:hypothetical protein
LIRALEQQSGKEVISQEEYDTIYEAPDDNLEAIIDKLKEGYEDYDVEGYLKNNGYERRAKGVFGYGR